MSTQTIEVGIRIGSEGMAFFGLEQVNTEIAAGARVVELRPGGAVVNKRDESSDTVSFALGGCQIVVVLERPS